jgi:hypothetical protein
LLNVCGVNGGRQTEMHTAEPLLHRPSASQVEVAMAKFKSLINTYRSNTSSIQTGGAKVCCEIQKFIRTASEVE